MGEVSDFSQTLGAKNEKGFGDLSPTQCDNDRRSLSISLLSIATKTNALNYACFGEYVSASIGEANFKNSERRFGDLDEVNSKGLSVSFRVDDGVIEHNNREIIAKNVDPARISNNITYTQIGIKQFYEQIFGKALTEYNARQTRSDRRINDYYEHIKKVWEHKTILQSQKRTTGKQT